ncbi:MAG: transcription termination factor Rho [Clostridiales bacterium]|nr:transcription termination factor Rho [Clostridiales bacterium]
MNEINFSELTVLELRKVAKEMQVPLGAGITKQGIIDKLTAARASQQSQPAPEQATLPLEALAQQAQDDSPAIAEDTEEAPLDAPDAPVEEKEEKQSPDSAPAEEAAPSQPQFKQAYVAPQRFNNRPAFKTPSYNRPGAPRTSAGMEPPRTQTTRPTGFQSRFGPAAQSSPAPQHEPFRDEERIHQEATRPSFGPSRTSVSEPPRPAQRPVYDSPRQVAYEQPRPAYEPSYRAPQQGYEQRGAYPPRQGSQEAAPFTVNPSANEIAQVVECPEITGVLELLPDGYGFLRSEQMIATSRDVYVAAAPIRRFGLRSGDVIKGKVRLQREGDKYAALLTVSQVNGMAPEAAVNRPNFDTLTPIYPTRRIQMECKEGPQTALRLMDLVTPIGFGQRGLIQCSPNTGKTRLLTQLANVITANHPTADVMLLLFNETPENVTVIRESVKCQVVASTFDMAPENHLRLADLVIERAERLVEMKRDVVVLVDSLTTLIHVISTAAMQAGRAVPGMISPQSLQKAKRLFGAARCIREGGSLTVIATMNTESGTKADDSVVNDFRGAANMELVLDQALARAGVYPPFELSRCGTRHAEAILSPEHIEGLKLLRSMLGRMPAENALREVTSMLDKTATNQELLSRIKVWADSMKG